MEILFKVVMPKFLNPYLQDTGLSFSAQSKALYHCVDANMQANTAAMLWYAMFWYAMFCYAMLRYAMLCYAMLCYAMLCYAMLCYAMLCYAMLCYAMLCYSMPYHVILSCAMVWC